MESEKSEYRNESEQREHEYQLCWEDMVIASMDACAQRQIMNMMFMAMIDRNGGDNSNPRASPSNTYENFQCLICLPRNGRVQLQGWMGRPIFNSRLSLSH